MAPNPKPLAEKLWKQVDIKGPDECWPYRSAVERDFYGNISNGQKGKQISSHVAAYELTYGPVPKGLVVRHTCDYKPCCNPSHLLLGTHADNVRDKVERGLANYTGPKKQVRCRRGHDDWYVQKFDGRRRCRVCRNANALRRSRKKQDIPEEPQ